MAAKKLSDKQKAFCREYLVDLNATQAAIRAGYSEKTAKEMGHENLTKPHIQAKIQRLMDKRSQKVEITAENVLNDILDIRDLCKEKSVTEDSEGNQQINKDAVNSRIKANELLGKHLKLFTDKVEHSGEINIPPVVIQRGESCKKEK